MSFIHDIILNEEDICNLNREKKILTNGVEHGKKMVVYGRRNSGKTSLLKNVIIPKFEKKNKDAFVVFCDFMEVKDIDSIASRLRASFEKAFMRAFPKETFVKQIKNFLVGLRPQITVDPLTGEPSLSITSDKTGQEVALDSIFEIIGTKIAKKMKVLLVLDEFQDISFVPEAQGLFRDALQKMGKVPIVIMGSKKHLLAKMFAVPDAPFADFGVDVEFQDIPHEEYYVYCQERLKKKGIKISLENSIVWQNLMYRNPEAMNILGAHIFENFSNKTINELDIRKSIETIISERGSRYEEYIGHLLSSEQEVLIAIARFGPVQEPSSKQFIKNLKSTHATILKAVRNLENHSYIEKNQQGYQLVNPMLKYYLLKNR